MMKDTTARINRFFYIIVSICLIFGCTSSPEKTSILVIKELDDIPDISARYDEQLSELKLGMKQGQVTSLFPASEKECFSDEICHFTVFEERQIVLDKRLADIDTLTTGLISALALTCLVADDSCKEAIFAAFNVSLAATLEKEKLKRPHNAMTFPVLINALNNQSLGINSDTSASPQRSKIGAGEPITLIQWINVKVENGRVVEWAVNEPLEQFKPKRFENKLPPLEEALGIKN